MGAAWVMLNSLLGLNISSVRTKVRISRGLHDLASETAADATGRIAVGASRIVADASRIAADASRTAADASRIAADANSQVALPDGRS